METIVSYAKTVLFFLLFVNLIMQMLKGSAYERFVRPVCGMILVILIVRPILHLFGADEKVLFAAEQKISLLLAQNETEFLLPEEKKYEFTVLEVYEKELEKQLSELLQKEGLCIVSADFSVSAEEKDFGTIRGLKLFAERVTEGEKDKVEIKPVVFSNRTRKEAVSMEEIRIKDKLADFYNLDAGNIYVSIREDQDG